MLVRRLLAFLVAVGLVVAALQVRARLFPTSPQATAQQPTTGEAPDLRVVCVRELEAPCDALADGAASVIAEDAADTVQRLTEPEPALDVWVTIAPWPEIAASARAEAGLGELPSAVSDVVGRSPMLLAVRRDRLEVLEPECGGMLTWRCVGDRAGRAWTELGGDARWGRVKVGIDQPDSSVTGLLTLAQAASSFFEGEAWNTRSLQSTAFFGWLSDLAEAADAPAGQTSLQRMLVTGGAEFEVVGALEAGAVQQLRNASSADEIVTRRPVPEVTADVVVVGYGDAAGAADDIAGRIAEPLAAAGWRVPDVSGGAASSGPPLPASAGLPSAPALEALRQLWIEVTRG